MITFIGLKNRLLLLQDDFVSLEEFITPGTDIHMLTLLSLACRDGLNLSDVDKVKFQEAKSNDLKIESSKEAISGETQFLNISLDHILKEGKKFTYSDFFDVFGLNSKVNAELLIQDLKMDIVEVLNLDFESTSENFFSLERSNIRTLKDLLDLINNNKRD
jgi:hypothetical protein